MPSSDAVPLLIVMNDAPLNMTTCATNPLPLDCHKWELPASCWMSSPPGDVGGHHWPNVVYYVTVMPCSLYTIWKKMVGSQKLSFNGQLVRPFSELQLRFGLNSWSTRTRSLSLMTYWYRFLQHYCTLKHHLRQADLFHAYFLEDIHLKINKWK